MSLLTTLWVKLFHPPFWYRWKSSWAVELTGGFALSVALALLTRNLQATGALGMGISLYYEIVLDPNKWDLFDVLQRAVGQLIGLFTAWPLYAH